MAEAELFDYQNPDYTSVFQKRARLISKIRNDSSLLKAAKVHYRHEPWQFITDWGMTFDPRKLDAGETPHMPFVLWPKQHEYVKWLQWMWMEKKRGQVEKSRDCGVTWLSVAWSCTNFLFVPGFVTGFGSRKAELVDKSGDPKTIFFMIRYFLDNIPVDFLPEGYSKRLHTAHMRVVNPETGAALIGEGGDQIGRGGRTSAYFVDEAAFVERQDEVDAALSATTECQVNISTFNGPGNRFFLRNQMLKGTPELFIFDWRDDPRKNEEWAEKTKADLNDEAIWAQEYERDPYASQHDSFIPAKHVLACIDAHEKLGFTASGIRAAGFDPADVGDAKGYAFRHGSILLEAEELRNGDITQAIPWAFSKADENRADVLGYDADGMGAPTMKLALSSMSANRVRIEEYHGGGGVEDPDGVWIKSSDPKRPDKTNHDAFRNYRSQTWTWVARRAKNTFDAVERIKQGFPANFDPENMLSISSKCANLQELKAELSSPKREQSDNGKIIVESKKKMAARGVKSPNLADAVVIAFSRKVPDRKKPLPRSKGTRRLKDRGMGY